MRADVIFDVDSRGVHVKRERPKMTSEMLGLGCLVIRKVNVNSFANHTQINQQVEVRKRIKLRDRKVTVDL